MNKEIVNALVKKYSKNLVAISPQTTRMLCVILFALSVSCLVTLSCFVLAGIMIALCIIEIAAIHVIIKKNNKTTLGNFIFLNMLLCTDTVAFFCVLFYFIQKANGVITVSIWVLFVTANVVCMFVGVLFTVIVVKRNKKEKSYTKQIDALSYVLPAALGTAMSSYVNKNYTVQMQIVFYSTAFAVGSFLIMFVLGRVHLPLLYFMKKCNITE